MSETEARTNPAADRELPTHRALEIPIDNLLLRGDWNRPAHARGLVLFAHGVGSSRFSPRHQFVARRLQEAGVATLLFDLLTEAKERKDATSGYWSFDIELLAHRLLQVVGWLKSERLGEGLPRGFFGSSTGAAAALVAAAKLGAGVQGVVSRGGRVDFAGDWLPQVTAPTLLIVGEHDLGVMRLNEWAFKRLTCEKSLVVVPRATRLFEAPGTLEEVATLAASWFRDHLKPDGSRSSPESREMS